jgi:hypothetical protein
MTKDVGPEETEISPVTISSLPCSPMIGNALLDMRVLLGKRCLAILALEWQDFRLGVQKH